jgi:RNase H-like domain found in reverse transcriptase
LTKKDRAFERTRIQQVAFDYMEAFLLSEPVLRLLKDDGEYILDTDASNFAADVVLQQMLSDNEFSPMQVVFSNLSKLDNRLLRKNMLQWSSN